MNSLYPFTNDQPAQHFTLMASQITKHTAKFQEDREKKSHTDVTRARLACGGNTRPGGDEGPPAGPVATDEAVGEGSTEYPRGRGLAPAPVEPRRSLRSLREACATRSCAAATISRMRENVVSCSRE